MNTSQKQTRCFRENKRSGLRPLPFEKAEAAFCHGCTYPAVMTGLRKEKCFS